MKFFVACKFDGETDKEAYERVKTAAVKLYTGWEITTDRIFGLRYKHNGKLYYAEVGKLDPERGGEIVTAIFSTADSDMCLIGTINSRRGETFVTMVVGKGMRPTLFDAE